MFTCDNCTARFERKEDLLKHLVELPSHKKMQPKKWTTTRHLSHQAATSTGYRGEGHVQSHTQVQAQKTVKKMTTVTESLQAVRVKQRLKLVFSLVQDASGSMSGSRMTTSLAGLDYMFENVFDPQKDFLGVVTYNTEVNQVHRPMPVKNVDKARDMAAILDSVGGRTATYDALGSAISDLKAMQSDEKFAAVTEDAVYQMLLVTDGDDNSSTQFNLQSVSELVKKPGLPHFHLHVIAVQMDQQEKANLEALCRPGHCTFHQAEDIGKLGKALRRVSEQVLQTVMCVQTIETVVENSGTCLGGGGRGGHQALLARPGASSVFRMSALGDSLQQSSNKKADTRKAFLADSGASYHHAKENKKSKGIYRANTVEDELLRLLRRHPSGIMGAHMNARYRELFDKPLQLGAGRKLKEVLLATGGVRLVGGDGPGDKLFMLK